jgi:hypothetical protein
LSFDSRLFFFNLKFHLINLIIFGGCFEISICAVLRIILWIYKMFGKLKTFQKKIGAQLNKIKHSLVPFSLHPSKIKNYFVILVLHK